jgi:hypothetical protein
MCNSFRGQKKCPTPEKGPGMVGETGQCLMVLGCLVVLGCLMVLCLLMLDAMVLGLMVLCSPWSCSGCDGTVAQRRHF